MELDYSAAERQRLCRKVCIVLHCCRGRSEKYEYNFYIVDRDSSFGGDEYPDMKPTMRFKGVEGRYPPVSFCALNSTLYMFEGDVLSSPGQGKFAGTFAGTFEMSPEILAGSDYELEKGNLCSIKAMHERKISPIAVPTPDGKSILVFSSEFFWGAKHGYDDSFELYDVAEDSWTLLPGLSAARPLALRRSCYHRIEAYGFRTDSRFLIRMDGAEFVLNFETGRWEGDSFPAPFRGGSRGLEGYFLGIDGFYLTPHSAYDITDVEKFQFYPYPLSRFPVDDDDDDDDDDDEDDYDDMYPYISLLGHEDDSVYDLGFVQAERPLKSEGPSKSNKLRVILDMYRIETKKFKRDVEIYKRDMEKFMESTKSQESVPVNPLLNITDPKTVKLMIDFDFHTYITGLMYLFSI